MSYIDDIDNPNLFKDAKYKKYNEIVSFKSKKDANNSVSDLLLEFYETNSKSKKLRIARVMQYASNRALASTKNPNLSSKERIELTEVGNLYKKESKELWDAYNKYK